MMGLIPEAVLLVFALAFFCVWLVERHRLYLLLFAVGFFLFGCGLTVEIVKIPANPGVNITIAGIAYVCGSLCIAQGGMRRSGGTMPVWMMAMFFIGIVGGTVYYYYGVRDLYARIYILNWGMGAIFLTTIYRCRFWLRGTRADKCLFWVYLVLGLHFFPRILLTIGTVTNNSPFGILETPYWVIMQLTVALAAAGTGLGLLSVVVADIIRELRKERDTDPLTGLSNRRLFVAHVARILQLQDKQPVPMVFAMIDVDHFKTYNDRYGHGAGDQALKLVAKTISTVPKLPQDIAARIGGEEFGLLLCNQTLDQAKLLLEQLCSTIHDLKIEHQLPDGLQYLSISIGAVEHQRGETYDRLASRADKLLYSSKSAGRNQVTTA